MRVLPDRHLLLWLVGGDPRAARLARLMDDPGVSVHFSVASLWEVGIKRARRADFDIDAVWLRGQLLDADFAELPIEAEHVFRHADLPPLHKDPFDRILVAQP